MKRFMLATLSAVVLQSAFAAGAFAAKPPSGDANPSDLANTSVDTSEIIYRGNTPVRTSDRTAVRPPSGDGNPSDLLNSSVDTSEIIYRGNTVIRMGDRTAVQPPSGDSNPSDLLNGSVSGRDIIDPTNQG